MSSGKNLVLLSLVALAAAGALFSRKAPQPELTAPQAVEPRGSLARRLPTQDPARAQARYLSPGRDEGPAKMPTAATPGSADPQLGFEFEPTTSKGGSRWANPAGALLDSCRNVPDGGQEVAPIASGLAPGAAAIVAPPASQRRTHVVVDGDTLTALAARYLGSSDRYREIFQANRGLLATPDLLPIGATLEIPAAGLAQPALPAANVPADGLVPVAPGALEAR